MKLLPAIAANETKEGLRQVWSRTCFRFGQPSQSRVKQLDPIEFHEGKTSVSDRVCSIETRALKDQFDLGRDIFVSDTPRLRTRHLNQVEMKVTDRRAPGLRGLRTWTHFRKLQPLQNVACVTARRGKTRNTRSGQKFGLACKGE